jgi:hypothetical protein
MSPSAKAVRKYREAHAEPDAGLAARLSGDYANVLVIPAYDEDAAFLQGIEPALRERTALCIVVVNAPADASQSVSKANQKLLSGLIAATRARLLGSPAGGSTPPATAKPEIESTAVLPPAFLGQAGRSDVLILDRSSGDHSLPAGEGVGLARKIGADLALELRARGQLESRWIHTTDADVRLPPRYFQSADDPEPAAGGTERGEEIEDKARETRDSGAGEDSAVTTYPFWHAASGEADLDRATAIYEISLRSYVLGLRWAGSPYAHHTVGSALAFDASAYAAVRGFPRRQAGEDFYLLNKLAKVGRVALARCQPIRISARPSDRVPFGTGRAVQRFRSLEAAGETPDFYDPRIFVALRHWLTALNRLGGHGDVDLWRETLRESPTDPAGADVSALRTCMQEFAADQNAEQVFTDLCRQHPPGPQLRRHLHGWFDAFRTLKLVHAVRDRGFPSLPWPEALRRAPHVSIPPAILGGDPDPIRAVLARQEHLPLR